MRSSLFRSVKNDRSLCVFSKLSKLVRSNVCAYLKVVVFWFARYLEPPGGSAVCFEFIFGYHSTPWRIWGVNTALESTKSQVLMWGPHLAPNTPQSRNVNLDCFYTYNFILSLNLTHFYSLTIQFLHASDWTRWGVLFIHNLEMICLCF